MHLLRDLHLLPESARGAAVAIGNFDGVHAGHQAILAETLAAARRLGKPTAVMTFEPHPRRVFKPELPPLKIYPFAEKIRRLAALGIEYLYVVRFTRAFAETSAEAFVEDLLVKTLGARHVTTGDNFIFGHRRRGNAETLEALSRRYGFGYSALPPVMVEGAPCSSTRIREALEKGDMPLAASLLGRPYSLCRRVVHGDARGRALGFPTANLKPSGLFLPARGVYAARARWEHGTYDGVANLGVRPTFGGTSTQLEFHGFSPLSASVYGQRLEVELIEHLRPEKAFESAEALKSQIQQDVEQAKTVLSKPG